MDSQAPTVALGSKDQVFACSRRDHVKVGEEPCENWMVQSGILFTTSITGKGKKLNGNSTAHAAETVPGA